MTLTSKSKILIAGAYGMVGSAIQRELKNKNYKYILAPSHQDLDYIQQECVKEYLKKHQPEAIVIAAAKVGGIRANATYPAEFIYENLMIASNLIHQAHMAGIDKVLFLGSTCIYPKIAPQPIKEEYLLTGSLEPSNEAYAIAKIAGLKLCQFYQRQYERCYISAMPTNLYGPGDNYHPENAHVIPALIHRFHEAVQNHQISVTIWGSGKPKREFLHVDDLAKACVYLLENYKGENPINVGSNDELTIRDLSLLIADIVGFKGKVLQDTSKLDGTPRKKTDCSKIHQMGWKAEIPLKNGLESAYNDYLSTHYSVQQ